jgi:DNA invertase Pin-like site-specific DNA recombinase
MHYCAETSNQRFFVMLVGYMRVSSESDRQITDLQRDALLAAGVDGRHLFEDHASGAKDDRLGLNQALTFVRPGDVLVVWKLDRLGRSLSHLLCIVNTLKEKQVAFRSLTEGMDTTTASGELLFHVGVSPTKVRKVPQDFCQQSGRKGFSAIPELPRRDLF